MDSPEVRKNHPENGAPNSERQTKGCVEVSKESVLERFQLWWRSCRDPYSNGGQGFNVVARFHKLGREPNDFARHLSAGFLECRELLTEFSGAFPLHFELL